MVMDAKRQEAPVDFDVDAGIEALSRWLPTQNPIKDFIQQNTLACLQDKPFHEALAIAAKIYGARSYLPLSYYQARYRSGRISPHSLRYALEMIEPDSTRRLSLRDKVLRDEPETFSRPTSIAQHGVRSLWLTSLEVNLDALAHPILFRLIGNFLDQGISQWSIAREGESLWSCIGRMVRASIVSLHPFQNPESREIFKMDVDDAIRYALHRLAGKREYFERYLLEMALAHPGWSGMVRVIEKNPQRLLSPRNIRLKDFLAVELAIQLAILSDRCGKTFPSVSSTAGVEAIDSLERIMTNPLLPKTLRVWQEAFEHSLYIELLAGLKKSATLRHKNSQPPLAQALFCIDDRECSIRRHLEEVNSSIKTYGAAGFFGIDFYYRGVGDIYPVAQCPAVITPRHLVLESVPDEGSPLKKTNTETGHLPFGSRSLMKGWLFTQTAGLGYAVRLAFDTFRPGSNLLKLRQLSEVDVRTRLHLLRESDEPDAEGRLLGFSRQEMAEKLEGLLKSIGLVRDFAPIVVVIAHGSTSTNNTHFAAYDCGACAGKPGAPNARAFAQMANDPQVREILCARGIDIPETTLFVAAMHNTTSDEVTYFDRHDWPEPIPMPLVTFQRSMDEALERNAHERCRWFELGPSAKTLAAAIEHVKTRSTSIFEPRPEYDHNNNLYCVVGNRDLTSSLFIDRRSFLHSYQPADDLDGSTLARILGAIIPVCGGINLQYFFSRIDNSAYGAGTKLPHNVIGLLGVANGVEGDLRTGLSSQMVEIHEAARLMIVVEQVPAIIDQAFSQISHLMNWLDNEWVRFASLDPSDQTIHIYRDNGWKKEALPPDFEVPTGRWSMDVYQGKTETIPVHYLTRGLA